ncbi:MAG: aspartyl protease family protein [Candidatus Rokubacteria bacterium]|nr:aspartyl protease family protein [Candidatus Rokubacteria bacterium]
MRDPRTVLALVSLALALLVSVPAAAEIYHWTDADGVDHYSTDLGRVPARYRPHVRVIDTPTPGVPSQPAPAPGTMLFTSGSPILAEAHVNGVPLTLLVDTGAARTVISPGALARGGFDLSGSRIVRIVGVTGVADVREVVVPRLDVAGAQVGPIAVIAHDVPSLRADGLLGRDVLDQFVLTIDAARGRAILSR